MESSKYANSSDSQPTFVARDGAAPPPLPPNWPYSSPTMSQPNSSQPMTPQPIVNATTSAPDSWSTLSAMPVVTVPSPGRPGAPGKYNFYTLARASRQYRWWRPLLVGLLLLVQYLLVSVVLGAVVGLLNPKFIIGIQNGLNDGNLAATPGNLLFLMGSVAVLLPLTFLAQRVGGWRKLGFISSVVGRIRWKWLLICFAISAIPYGFILALAFAGANSGEGPGFQSAVAVWTPLNIALLVVLFLVVPIQCAAEEYLYRGYLGQLFGGWFKHAIWGVILPAPFFVLSHGYSGWASVSVGLMAILGGVMAWRTGGLEAGIALHTANNLIGVVAMTWITGNFNAKDSGDGPELLFTAIAMLVIVGVVLFLAPRFGIVKTTEINMQGDFETPN